MSESTLPLSSGILTKENQNEDIAKSSKLTDEYKKLIEDNYSEIKKILYSILTKTSTKNIFIGHPKDIVYEACSYIPEVAMEYNQELAGSFTFAQFASQRCILRFIDEYRRLNKHIRVNRNKIKITSDARDDLINEDGFVDDDKLRDALIKSGLDADAFIGAKRPIRENVIDIPIRSMIVDPDTDKIDYDDFVQGVLNKADRHFKASGLTPHKFDSAAIHKILIKEHLIPKARKMEYKTLGQISKEVDLSEGRLSQIVHGDKMKRFFNLFLENVKI